MTRTKWIGGIVAALAVAGAVWQTPTLRVWWAARQLAEATPTTREAAAEAVAALGDSAFSALFDPWTTAEGNRRENLEAGLRATIRTWPTDDPRWSMVGERLGRAASSMNVDGRKSALRFAAAMVERLGKPLPTGMADRLEPLLKETSAEALAEVIQLATALVERSPESAPRCREIALAGFADPDPATRAAAVQLALHDPLRSDAELLAKVEPLLLDAAPRVRRLALIAIGGDADLLADDALMPLLHDGDAEVRRLCEVAFRGRGLDDGQIRLARLISDPNPTARLQVVVLLRQTAGLDADVWLRRLTTDPAPAVRAAAARAAAQSTDGGLRERLAEMSRLDPSPTVREIARFHLDQSIRRTVAP